MADFAPNVTPRYLLHYHVANRDHSVMCRGARGSTFAQMSLIGQNLFNTLFTNLAAVLADDLAFLSAEVALTDSDLFFPAGLPIAVVGTVPVANITQQNSITHITFSGRGSLGSKTSLKIYGLPTNPNALPANVWTDFVLLASESAPIAAAVGTLNAGGTPIVTVDNSKPVFAERVTVKVNDFWLRRVRQGL